MSNKTIILHSILRTVKLFIQMLSKMNYTYFRYCHSSLLRVFNEYHDILILVNKVDV